ncbi:MAG: sodium/solute symporter [Nitrososphaera sp.]|uniref:sodium:solute symporter family transporter n=1 Tax=Nitrososphaera sp. TaxID=1971748 RepID=UPI0017BB91CB|nr:sodium/solute symporter [Nitrososphaera sp.]NWG37416.1 sodium/solute symporter [Nitrososphaera sp.]
MGMLSEGIGYFVLLGVGLVMALVVTLLVRAETKWLGTRKTFEWFYTAGRNVKTGLIATSVVSAWTWAATLLQSSTVAYQFGISGPFWYAAGASIQVVLFAILAIELKRKVPTSHTFPEVIYARFGRHAHKIFLFFALMTNTIVTAMLVLGGAAVVNSLTGVNIYVAAFLIPVGVIIYTLFGGLKATFFADYLNTTFIFVVILIFVTAVYFASPHIGGITGMFDKLAAASALRPVEGNSMGAYLTMASAGALVFGVINIVGNFGTVFVDQAYWQRAIAARPRSAISGFLVGGLAWFAIPFALATTLGLGAVAVGVSLTPEQIGMGLVAPAAASQLLGDIGAILLLTMLFTAVTSAGSAELVAVSSLVTYDVYRTYVKPSSTGRELLRVSRVAILGFGIGMGILATMLLQVGASLQYVYLAMGILIGSAVAPITIAVVWKKANKVAATSAALIGLALGVAAWLGSASVLYGEITVQSTGQQAPLLIGNVTAISVGALVSILGSLVKPENFNFEVMKQKILVVDDRIRSMIEHDTDEKFLKKSAQFSYRYAIALTLVLVVVWPLPLYFSGYVFSSFVYHVWIGIAVAWAAGAAGVVIVLPLVEARRGISVVLRRITTLSFSKDEPAPGAESLEHERRAQYDSRKILVAVDGSKDSLSALTYASYLYDEPTEVKIFLLNVIEWTDESDGSVDERLASEMEEEGKRMLRSVMIPKKIGRYERIVKLGDPATKIAETAEKLGVDMIVMGRKGLGGSHSDVGHVTAKVLQSTSRPVVLL